MWTDLEDATVMVLWDKTELSIKDIAKRLGRTELAVKCRIMKHLEQRRTARNVKAA